MNNITFSKTNLTYLILFLLMAFPGWYIGKLRVSILLSTGILFILFLLDAKLLLKKFKTYLKSKNVILVLLLMIWIICSGTILSIFTKYNFSQLIITTFFRIIPLILLPFFAGFFVSNRSADKTLDFYCKFVLFVLVMGGIDFVLSLMHIDILQKTIVNHYSITHPGIEKATYMYIPRIQSIFDEPCGFGLFICVHLPLIYNISKSTIKLFNNKTINFLIKKILPFYALLMLLGTMSPIFFSIGIIISVIYYFNKNKKKRFIYYSYVFVFLLLIYVFLDTSLINITNTFLERIPKTLNNLHNFNEFIHNSPSLANRITHYINLFIIFIHHPIAGVGFDGVRFYFYDQLFISPVSLTEETLKLLLYAKHGSSEISINTAIFWHMLAEIGIIGIILLYGLFISVMWRIRRFLRIYKFYNNYFFLEGLFYALIIIIILTFYAISITDSILWCILGIGSGLYYKKNVITYNNIYEEK